LDIIKLCYTVTTNVRSVYHLLQNLLSDTIIELHFHDDMVWRRPLIHKQLWIIRIFYRWCHFTQV